MLRITSMVFLVAGCTQGGGQSTPRDLALQMSMDDMMSPDLARPARDLAGMMSSGCHVVINELLTGTTQEGTEEWIELHNPCGSQTNLAGWTLRYRSDNNVGFMGNDTILVNVLQATIAAGAYLLYGGAGYGGSKDGALGGGLGTDGGGVGLVNPGDQIVDAVAYGNAIASHKFLEGTVAPKPPIQGRPGRTIARSPNGVDSDDNGADFVSDAPSPRAAN